MKVSRIGFLFFTLALLSTGCFKHSFTSGSGGNVQADARYSKWHAHWLMGLIGETDVDVRSVCPSGNATVKDEMSFLNSVVGAFVGVIYYPTTVEVYCDGGRAASLSLSPEQLRAVARDADFAVWASAVSPERARELASVEEGYERRAHRAASTSTPPSHL